MDFISNMYEMMYVSYESHMNFEIVRGIRWHQRSSAWEVVSGIYGIWYLRSNHYVTQEYYPEETFTGFL